MQEDPRSDQVPAAVQEDAGLQGALCYEDLLKKESLGLHSFRWAHMEENTACSLCYTSGTTGPPKVWLPLIKSPCTCEGDANTSSQNEEVAWMPIRSCDCLWLNALPRMSAQLFTSLLKTKLIGCLLG